MESRDSWSPERTIISLTRKHIYKKPLGVSPNLCGHLHDDKIENFPFLGDMIAASAPGAKSKRVLRCCHWWGLLKHFFGQLQPRVFLLPWDTRNEEGISVSETYDDITMKYDSSYICCGQYYSEIHIALWISMMLVFHSGNNDCFQAYAEFAVATDPDYCQWFVI